MDSLQSYLNAIEDDQLPEFWFQLAAASKKQEFSIIREFFDAHARGPSAFILIAPIPTPKLLMDLTGIMFLADHPDYLKTGIQPFAVLDGSEECWAASLEIARSFNLLYEWDFSVAFADLERFMLPKDLRSYPITFFDLECNLGIFDYFLSVILGDLHPLTLHYRQFWEVFSKQ